MSYVSVLKNIPEFLSQPAGIAAIASVGIHGAIAFILPLMPVDSKPKQKASPASVGIVELSQEEQNRLPQQKGPKISALPQVPLQSALPLPKFATKPTTLGKLPPSIDSTKLILPPLPKSSANLNIPSIKQKNQPLPILPQPNFNSSFNAKAKSSGSYRRFNQKMKLGPSASSLSRRRSAASRTPSPKIPPLQPAPFPADITRIPAPPPLSPTGNSGMGVNGVPVNQPKVVNPQVFVAPTNRDIPKPSDKLTLAGQSVKQWGQQQSGPIKIKLPKQPEAAQTTKSTPQNTRTLALAKQFEQVRVRYPNSEIKQPISDVIKIKPGKEGKAEGTLVIDSNGIADYLQFVDSKTPSKLKKETRNYFRKYFKKNPIRKNGRAKVYAFTLDFKSNVSNSAELSKPQKKIVDRLLSTKDKETQLNQKPSNQKSEGISRSSTPVKINVQPNRGTVVVPSVTSAPVKVKPQIQIRTPKPAPSSQNNGKPAVKLPIRNNQEVPQVPAKPKPQARINIKQPTEQGVSKPSISTRLRNSREDSVSGNNSKKASNSRKKLIEQLRKVKEERESSN